jgi:subtilisin family serine protease
MTISGTPLTIKGKQKLDPKVRRLVFSASEPTRLPEDISRAFLTAADDFDPATPDASKLSKRVLVKLRANDIPQAFGTLQWSQIVDEIYTVTVPLTRLDELGDTDGVELVSAGNFLGPTLNTSLTEIRADDVHAGRGVQSQRTGTGVVVGIIDFGFDFTLADFRDAAGGTRVAFFWNQGITPQANERSPANFPYGVEYTAQDINNALATPDPFAVVRPHYPGGFPLDVEEHGTHVAGIAAGNGRSGDATFPAGNFVGVAPDATIIFVQPDSSDVGSSFTDSVHVADAIRYIFETAEALHLPCVINMSLGQNGGSHDGESVVERAMDRLLESQPGRAMIVAAGNEHIWRGHASGTLTAGQSRTLQWRVGGQMPIPGGGATGSGIDRTPNELEIWYSSRDRFRVRVTDPTGEDTQFVDPGDTNVFQLPSGDRVFVDSVRFSPLNGEAQIYIEVLPKPGPTPASAPRITAGIWQIELQAVESRDGRFDAWIERDARIGNNNFADQSFFVGSDFDPVMTLGTPATNRRAVAVANYSHVTQAISSSSSHGPTRDGRLKPEVAAPGTNIFSSNSLGGRLLPNQPNPNPVRVAMSGTSMSAPHVTGIVALMLEANPRLTAPQLRKILMASARPPLPGGTTAFTNDFGFGRVDAVTAVQLAEALV